MGAKYPDNEETFLIEESDENDMPRHTGNPQKLSLNKDLWNISNKDFNDPILETSETEREIKNYIKKNCPNYAN